ncbi:MAG: LPXTG cell wall anchor domain-containing protein [Ilumatobacter sp.]|uniref:LPXTG cell wall anchor domain-containing protein n=1 Tax=Ilumatobacter sp. TaxID=1967498 RepID=UPI00391B872C
MSKFFRILVAGLVAVVGSIAFLPGVAQASVNLNVSFSFPPQPLTVGDTNLPVVLTLSNTSDDVDVNQEIFVCNNGDPAPCGTSSEAPPKDQIGIGLTPSCAGQGASTTCAVLDPGVFEPTSLTATGGGVCAGVTFGINIEASGTWRFTPLGLAAPGQIVLPPGGATCTISFSLDVVSFPTGDWSPGATGQQTGILASVTGYSPDDGNPGNFEPADRAVSSSRTINRAQPEIETTASPAITLGNGVVTDTALVTGRVNPDATAGVRFRLYGPDDATCSGTPVFDETVQISSAGNQVTSPPYTPMSVGTYRWIASYLGDSNNSPVSGACNDANESVVVAPGQPTLTTQASPAMRLGEGQLTDTANVTGRINPQPGATISFALYGPDDDDCSGTPIFTSNNVSQPVADGPVVSGGYTPTAPGVYRWIASYSGDVNNLAAEGECNDPGESTVVDRALPVLTTDAGDDVRIGDELTDTATVTGRIEPLASTIDFRLYGPNDDDCSGSPIFEQLGVPLAADADTVTSSGFTPTVVGVYRWVAEYSGDVNNEGSIGECGDPAETVEVRLGQPTIVTQASPSVPVGIGQLSDEAIVNGRVNPQPGATVSFRLYGPTDPTCSGTPVFEDLNVPYPVAGGTIRSALYTPLVVGTYRWVASYSGDANNLPAIGECGDPAETVVVTAAGTPQLPATGSETDWLLRSGGLVLLAGLALMGVGSRRRFV